MLRPRADHLNLSFYPFFFFLLFFCFVQEVQHLTGGPLPSIGNPSTKVSTLPCQPLQIDAGLLFWFSPQISRHTVEGLSALLINHLKSGLPWLCVLQSSRRLNTHKGADGERSFYPAFTVALDLSTGQGLAVQVLKELLRSVSCFLEVSSIFTAALFSSVLKCL